MNDSQETKTGPMAVVTLEPEYLVHYAKADEGWYPLDVDDAVSLDDARKLASARQALGYRTKIIEKKTKTQVF